MIVLLTFAVYLFTGCDNSNSGSNVHPPPSPPPTGNVIGIGTAAQLDDVRNGLGGNYRLTANISLSSYGVWEPIGSIYAPFMGSIDGNGYAITGLTVETGRTESYAGLFGYVEGGVIKNLALENVDVNGRIYSGAIAGYMKNSTILNSSSTGHIYGDTAGGIVGGAENGVIEDSYSTVSVYGEWDAGGLAGYTYKSRMENCLSAGDIYADKGNAGGIAGYLGGGIITNCGSEGDIDGLTAGGITGTVLGGTISYSDSIGYIYGAVDAGGIAGYVDDDSVITDSFSTGDVFARDNAAGGIAGYIWGGRIEYCFSEGYIDGYQAGGIAGYAENNIIYYCDGVGGVYGELDAGGIAGTLVYGRIEDCFNEGDIDGYHAGGIAGTMHDSTIIDCVNEGDVYAVWDAGGIVGSVYGYSEILYSSSYGFIHSDSGRAGYTWGSRY